jgi:hypothetical protein
MVEGAEAEVYTVVAVVLVYTDSHDTMVNLVLLCKLSFTLPQPTLYEHNALQDIFRGNQLLGSRLFARKPQALVTQAFVEPHRSVFNTSHSCMVSILLASIMRILFTAALVFAVAAELMLQGYSIGTSCGTNDPHCTKGNCVASSQGGCTCDSK